MLRRPVGRALDTSDDGTSSQVERWRIMTPAEKADLAAALYRATMQMMDAGIAERYPHADDRERFLRRAILMLGRDLAVAAYPAAARLND